MIVVSNTSPLNYLILVEAVHLLPSLFGTITIPADLIILDERPARKVAESYGLRVTGTLGLLNFAGQCGLLNIPQVVERLKRTSFRATPAMYKWLLNQHPDHNLEQPA